jgi:hypothetical protein
LAGWYFVNTARTNFSQEQQQQNNQAFESEYESEDNENQTVNIESNKNHNTSNKTLSKNGAKNVDRSKSTIESTKIIPFTNKQQKDDWRKHAIEAGINLNFPGISEQKYRYTKPIKPEYKNFVLNPQPDYKRFDRPITMAACYPISTEYTSRYQYPDSNKIDKFPWIKQF